MISTPSRILRWLLPALTMAFLGVTSSTANAQIRVCASVPDLGNLVREVGGDQVVVTVFAKGIEDPHFVEPRPGFVRDLNQADLLVQVGMSLEAGWLAPLVRNARNPRIAGTGTGFLDASTAIKPLEVPTGQVDRTMGDVHAEGNPHYLLDPLNGLRVARLIRDRLIELRPDSAQYFRERYDSFAKRVAVAMIGEELAKKYSVEDVGKLALLHEHGRLGKFLKEQKQDHLLGGWLGLMLPHYGAKAVDDHNMWPYFARRFGIRVIGHLEPKPGIAPTTQHLQGLIRQMQNDSVRVILASPYFNARHAAFVAGSTNVRVVDMAHQVGARGGTDDYLAMVDYNVRQLAAALSEQR